MAVAVKNASEAAPRSSLEGLALSSLVGAAYVLGSIGVVFYALPGVWSTLFPRGHELINPFLSGTVLLLLVLSSAVGLVVLAGKLVGPQPPAGLKAGVATVLIALAAIALVAWCFGATLAYFVPAEGFKPIGLTLMSAVAVGLLFLFFRYFTKPEAEDYLLAFEHQGWFSATAYKKSQGQRVRRATILGILVLAGCGIYALVSHGTLAFDLVPATQDIIENDWWVAVPFATALPVAGPYVKILGDVRFTVPLLLLAATFWFSWRLVNYPTFADFLIATEAEMNKVSWTTRKRLYQDTMVVLVTVVFMTAFLFFVDMAWGFLLSQVGVLKTGDQKAVQEAKEQPW